MIKRREMDLSEERKILGNMITNTKYLQELSGIVNPELFETPYCQIIGSWVFEYVGETNVAPQKDIESIFLRKKKYIKNDDDLEMIGEFLNVLSSDWARWQQSNVDYSLKGAIEYFRLRATIKLSSELQVAVDRKDLEGAEKIISDFRKIEKVGRNSSVDILTDAHKIEDAYTHQNEFLFKFPGAMGQVIGDICRGDFIGYQAPPKRGKTWHLFYAAQRALEMRLDVAVFSLEMPQAQITRRLWNMINQKPTIGKTVMVPAFDEEDSVISEEVELKGVPRNLEDIQKSQAKYRFNYRGGSIRTEFRPADTMSPTDVEQCLDNWEVYDNWVPDVIVMDYADLMAPDGKQHETRHKLDNIWKRLRAVAQDRNIAVITASQGGIRKVDSNQAMKVGDIAEDARKLAHVTKLIMLNQTPHEKEMGIMQVTSPLQRETSTGQSHKTAIVLQCLDMGAVYVDSRFKEDCNLPHTP